jgi:hypothetical protein
MTGKPASRELSLDELDTINDGSILGDHAAQTVILPDHIIMAADRFLCSPSIGHANEATFPASRYTVEARVR